MENRRKPAPPAATLDINWSGKARPRDDLRVGDQGADHGLQCFGAEDHRLVPARRMQQPIGKDMTPLQIGARLRLVERHEGDVAVGHGFGGAQEPACVGRDDLFLAGHQRDRVRALERDDAVIDFAGQQAEREADDAARMRAHPLDREVRLAGVRRPENGRHIARYAAGHIPYIGLRAGRCNGLQQDVRAAPAQRGASGAGDQRDRCGAGALSRAVMIGNGGIKGSVLPHLRSV